MGAFLSRSDGFSHVCVVARPFEFLSGTGEILVDIREMVNGQLDGSICS